MTEWLLRIFVKDNAKIDDMKVRSTIGSFAGYVGIVCNVLLCSAKAAVGLIAGSLSIVADALNNLSDAASNIISLLGFKLATKPADKDHPYGHGRYEYLSGLVVTALVLVIGVELFKSSIEKIITPSPVEFSFVLVIVLLLSIGVKLWMTIFNKKIGKMINSQTLIATSVDSRNDVITTGAVLIAVLISYYSGFELDAWMGLGVSVFIMYSGYGLLKDTLDPLLGQAPDPALIKHIEEKALSYEGILGIHDLMVHDYGPGRIFASFHAEVAAETDVLISHEIIDDIESDFRHNENLEVVIHLDPIVTSDPRVAELRTWVAGLISQRWDKEHSIHDFRMVPGEGHTNLIFDMMLPYSSKLTPEQAKLEVENMVKAVHPDFFCVIQVDRDYVSRS